MLSQNSILLKMKIFHKVTTRISTNGLKTRYNNFFCEFYEYRLFLKPHISLVNLIPKEFIFKAYKSFTIEYLGTKFF